MIGVDRNFDILINCIGVLKNKSEKKPVEAIRINSLFPHELYEICEWNGSKMIQLSSDAYKSEDIYGISKHAGEIDYGNHLTIRTSIIGPELKSNGAGLFDWFMKQEGEIDGFANHYWDGVTTLQLGELIKNIVDGGEEFSGILDYRSDMPISKYDLLKIMNSVFDKELRINRKDGERVDYTNRNPDLECELDIRDQLSDLKSWMKNHKNLYRHYSIS
jgi:dTDP-4-dehydrorhamnose reductase